jgi:16S rRNA C1402 N4-methylase RsmH
MFPPRPTELLHLLLKSEITLGDFVIDATAGNGHDTIFLAKAVGQTGQVLAIDIQPQAITSTEKRLENERMQSRVDLQLANHADLTLIAHGRVPRVILFNLGYLPGSDHGLITQTKSTLVALAAAVEILKPGGILAVICYPGHLGGDDESIAAEALITSLPQHRTARYSMLSTEKPAPFLLISQKPG